MIILKTEIVKQLSKELSLPFVGTEQDWDIEMADPNRVKDFLEFYRQHDLSADEKVAVMALILASYDEFLSDSDLEVDGSWEEIKTILESQMTIFVELIDYWSLPRETNDHDLFRITPLVKGCKTI